MKKLVNLARRGLLTPETLVLVFLALAGCAFWWTKPKPVITEGNYHKIVAKMEERPGDITEQEVAAILGAPAGDYTTVSVDPSEIPIVTQGLMYDHSKDHIRKWEGDEYIIKLAVEKETGKVVGAMGESRNMAKTGWFGRIKYRVSKIFGR